MNRAEEQMREAIVGPDAKFEAELVDAIDLMFLPGKPYLRMPTFLRAAIESLVESARRYERSKHHE